MLGERGEAEDAAQETFLRAYAHLDRYDADRPFRTWLLSIASNHCIDRLRKRRLTWLSLEEPLPPHPALNSHEADPEDAVISNEPAVLPQQILPELHPNFPSPDMLPNRYISS